MGKKFRTAVGMALSLTFLYYGIAWAVLTCSDHDPGSIHGANFAIYSHRNHDNLNCLREVYHTEVMASASQSLSRLGLSAADLTPHANDSIMLQIAAGDQTSNLWLRTLFDNSPPFLTLLPRYLSVVSLRI